MNIRLKSKQSSLQFSCPLYTKCILTKLVLIYHFRISEAEYVKAIKEEINKVVKLQEELDIDVLVHGEPEVSSNLIN